MNTPLFVYATLTPDQIHEFLNKDINIDFDDGGDTAQHQGALLFPRGVQAFLLSKAERVAGILATNVSETVMRQNIPLFLWIMRRDALRFATSFPEQPLTLIIDEAVAAFNVYVCAVLDLTCTEFSGEKPFRKLNIAMVLGGQQALAASMDLPFGTFQKLNQDINARTPR